MITYFLNTTKIIKITALLFLIFFSCERLTHAQEPIIAITERLVVDERVATLGEKLFHDVSLSRSNNLSCATCHPLSNSTTDGLAFSYDNQGEPLTLNTPSVNYTVLNHYFSWTGRFTSLAHHLDGLIQNPKILDMQWPELINKLLEKDYEKEFYQAGFDRITQQTITDALIMFQRSLITPSRFDLFLAGDINQITEDEAAGYDLFKQYGCISCHQGINIGGNMRQKFGVMKEYFDTNGLSQRDLGYFNTSQQEDDKFNFRVPSLRNVSLTAPYFHDASADTLRRAIEIMIEYQLGVSIPDSEITLIESFLGSLEGIDIERVHQRSGHDQ